MRKVFTVEKAEAIVAKYADREDLDVRIKGGLLQTRKPGAGWRKYADIEGFVIHKFEKAGLGKAPFRFVGISENRGPKTISTAGGVETTVGAPGQPMGSCDYCGMGIAEEYHIQSSDGREFVVGCECVRKTGDAGLVRVVKDHERKKARARREKKEQARQEKAQAREEQAREALADEDVRKALEAQASPTGRGTALEYCDFILEDGRYGTGKAVGLILKAAEVTS
jgi:hypothetical protein